MKFIFRDSAFKDETFRRLKALIQQKGSKQAKYGKHVLKQLSEELNTEFGKGFSVDTLENIRKFYVIYQNRISEKLYQKFAIEKSDKVSRIWVKKIRFDCGGRIM